MNSFPLSIARVDDSRSVTARRNPAPHTPDLRSHESGPDLRVGHPDLVYENPSTIIRRDRGPAGHEEGVRDHADARPKFLLQFVLDLLIRPLKET